MEDLQIQTRMYRVGGDLVWNDWQWTPDYVLRWLQTNMWLLLILLTVVIATVVMWRFMRSGTPRR